MPHDRTLDLSRRQLALGGLALAAAATTAPGLAAAPICHRARLTAPGPVRPGYAGLSSSAPPTVPM